MAHNRTSTRVLASVALAAAISGCASQGTSSTPTPPREAEVAEEATERSAQDVAAELANPLAPITSLAAQVRAESGVGPSNDTNRQVRLQPSFFKPFEGDSALLVRSIVPLKVNDWPVDESGLGDVSLIPYYVPNTRSAAFVGYGAAFGLDTASEDSLGSGRTTAGPAVLFAATGDPITWGGLVQHVWSVDDSERRGDVDVTTVQPFVTRLLGDGWAATLSSEVAYNWEAASDDAWTVPLQVGASKVVSLGGEFINLGAAFVQYVEAPELAAEWELRLTATYVLR